MIALLAGIAALAAPSGAAPPAATSVAAPFAAAPFAARAGAPNRADVARLGAAVGAAAVRPAPRPAAPGPAAAPAPAATPVPSSPAPAATATPAATVTPTAAPTAAPTATPEPTLPAPSSRSVSINGVEYAFSLSQTTVDAGDVRVQLDLSRAQDPHRLIILDTDGELVSDSGEQAAGSVTKRTVTLSSGTYRLVCPLAGHAERGMRAGLTVR